MSFREQLIITLVDKLVIGLIILYAGWYIKRALETFKNYLQLRAKEHEIRFSKLHEKRADAVVQLYRLLESAKLESSFFALRLRKAPDKDLNESASRVLKDMANLSIFYKDNKLYFSKELSDRLGKLIGHVVQPFSKYHSYSSDTETLAERVKEALEVWEKESSNVDKVLGQIEGEFRIMLGSEMDAASNLLQPTAR